MDTRMRLLVALIFLLVAVPLVAQQTGSISGKVLATDGSALPGVTVEARSNILPQPRTTTTDGAGNYRLPALAPGNYTLTFSLAGMQTATRKAIVLLGQDIPADVTLGVAGISESVTVTAEATLVNTESTAIQSGLNSQEIQQLPLQQDYRDLQKLIPGVMYTQDTVRGASAGASGQDNVYMFDGVNITMPLFGVQQGEPNNYDIAQVSVVRGGAKAIDFNRAGGFQIDTVSKSGTNKFSGQLGYQILRPNFVAAQTGGQKLQYQQKKSWTTASIGGPILSDRMFFYGSYYRPLSTRQNVSNLYGPLPQYERTRRDGFGKITFTPTQSWLINGSYRDYKDIETPSFGAYSQPTIGIEYPSALKLATGEASWVINQQSFGTMKLSNYKSPGQGYAQNLSSAVASTVKGTHLDIANLAQMGVVTVPTLIPGNTAQNAFVQPFINQYGYTCPPNASSLGLTCTPGAKAGGGTVGVGRYARDDDTFWRKSGQIGYNYSLGSNVMHDLHVGYQQYKDSEDRFQSSNGWGALTIPAGVAPQGTCPASVCGTATPAYFIATVAQQGATGVPTIHSEFVSQNIELNDSIRANRWTFNVGLLASQDALYGQGLKKADNIAGFVGSVGSKYLMHVFKFKDMVQPRLGATWAYNGSDTVYVSAARYMVAANSDARAASWDRNLATEIAVYFDQNGNELGIQPNASSTGKWWQAGIKHPEIKEYMIGTARQLTHGWSARVYGRYRKGDHFIDDTNNVARLNFNAPANIPHELYVPNLTPVSTPGTILNAIGSGGSYVIANLDGAFTKYYEMTAESDWRGRNLTMHGSYTWSHYYGNFDQDNSSVGSDNDAARFIGSSNIGDGAGRQLWDMKYGNLRADRRNIVKLNATYAMPWKASAGAYFIYQSGQPYQIESVLPYRVLTSSTSDTIRFAEPAGSRLTPAHHQLDLNYTQNFPLPRGLNFQLAVDAFNIYNKQTGYNYEDRIGTLGFTTRTDVPTIPIPPSIPQSVLDKAGVAPGARVNAPYATSYYAPRRFQVSARVQF